MQVKEIMTKECTYIDPNTTFQEAAKIMQDKNIGCLPVGENDRLVGVITDRDIVVRGASKGKDNKNDKVKDAMTTKCLYCFEDDTIEETSQNMTKNKVRRLPVLNSKKRLVGIVTLGDIASKGSKQAAAETLSKITRH